MASVSTGFLDEELSTSLVHELLDIRPWMKSKKYTLIRSMGQLEEYIDQCIEVGETALDLETTGLNNRFNSDGTTVDKIVGVCLANNDYEGIYIAIRHTDERYNLPPKLVMEQVKRLVANSIIVFHNFKFDGEFLRGEGIIIEDADRYEDTMLLAYVENAALMSKGLKDLSKNILNQEMIEIKDLVPDKAQVDFASVPPKTAVYYAGSDAICTYGLRLHYRKRFQELNSEGLNLIYRIEKRCMLVVMETERNKAKIDRPYFQELELRVEQELEDIVAKIYAEAGRTFDIMSPLQLGVLLFDEMKIPYPKGAERGANGQYKTNEEVLEQIKEHKIASLVLEYRGLRKIKDTYITNFLKNADDEDCVKFKLNPTQADTGRFSATGGYGLDVDGYSGVNCQNIPANYDPDAIDIRRGIIARPGYQMVAIDYSGEELRIATNMSKEKRWLDEFIFGSGDLHSITARIIFGKQEVSKQERGVGKSLNFLTIYGGGAGRFSQVAGIPIEEAQTKLADFFEELPGLSGWLRKEMREAKKRGYSLTSFGRRRPLQDLFNSGEKKLEAKASRMAVNSAVQGTGADIIKIAMYKVWRYIRENGLEDDVRFIMPIHDEIVFEMKKDKLDELIPAISEVMKMNDLLKGALKWKVGLEVDAEYGDTFHVDHDYFKELKKRKAAGEIPQEKPKDAEVSAPEKETAVAEVPPEADPPADGSGVMEFGMGGLDVKAPKPKENKVPPSEPAVTDTPAEVDQEKKDSPFYDYKVKKSDWVAKKQADLIWVVLAAADQYSTGPKKRIRLLNAEGELLYVSASKLSVDGFVAMAINYDI